MSSIKLGTSFLPQHLKFGFNGLETVWSGAETTGEAEAMDAGGWAEDDAESTVDSTTALPLAKLKLKIESIIHKIR